MYYRVVYVAYLITTQIKFFPETDRETHLTWLTNGAISSSVRFIVDFGSA